MMTIPTNNNIPSNSVQDRLYNAEKFDEFMNSDNPNYTDRKGVSRWTISGMRRVVLNWIESLSESNGADIIGTASGVSLAYRLKGIGNVESSVADFIKGSVSYDLFSVKGFYEPGDGGDGIWIKTGNVDITKASTHVVTEAKIYNAVGEEYALDVTQGRISVLANGAVAYSYTESIDQSTDDFVCLGQVCNGIQSRITLGVSTGNNEALYDGGNRLELVFPTNRYRVGKEPIKGYSGVDYYLGRSRIMVFAGASYTYKVTGKRLDGFRYGYEEIKDKWIAVNRNAYWGSVSAQDINIYGGTFIGDHDIRKLPEDCSAGVGILILNPEGVTTYGTVVKSNFNWSCVFMPAMLETTTWNNDGHAFDNNDLDYKYVLDYMTDAGATSRFGNFNRVTHYSCKFEGGRRGSYRNGVDWSSAYNCEITNRSAWRNANNVSGSVMEYIIVLTGTAFHASGCYLGPAAAKDYNARLGSVYGTAQNHTFTSCYTEWTYNFYTISKWGFNGKASRLQGLRLDCVSVYKDNFTEYSQIRFEGGCFGTINDKGEYLYPEGFYHYDTPNGQAVYTIGSPTRDLGAFRHGGFDFKYGPYNTYLLSGTDWESWRDRGYAKEMFNPYGLQVNSGTVFIPWQQPAMKSMACIWIKDFTGNFDPYQCVAWQTAASQESSGNTDTALYKSFAEKVVDYGNGYKMIVLTNKRLSGWDGIYTYARNANIVITVNSATPIALIAVEAYTGGVPLFPNGVDSYLPNTPATSVMSVVTNQVGMDSSLGGGLFFNGDIIGPWSHIRRNQSGYRITPSLTTGYTMENKMVTGGCSLEASMKPSFSATVVSVDATNSLTTISIPSANLPYVAVGIPLYVVSGSSTSTTGQVHLLKRIMNADGTASGQYSVIGIIGSVGDVLSINQSLIPSYTFFNDRSFNKVDASSLTVNGLPVGYKVAVPASATASGSPGQWAIDSNYVYYCTATNTWVRSAVASW